LPALLAEVKAGHPVIVFENLALSWLPQWHYAVVYGYDLSKPEVLMHSGPEAAKHWDMRKFERSWMLADYWGLVVLPPDRLAASADELANVTAAAGLEQAGKLNEAQMAYQQIIKKWPQSLPAAIGLGNISFAQKNPVAAVQVLQQAAKAHAESAVVWHNLAIAQSSARMKVQARASAQKALQLVPADERDRYQENLKQILN
jgi:predicted Zn-dependent protease